MWFIYDLNNCVFFHSTKIWNLLRIKFITNDKRILLSILRNTGLSVWKMIVRPNSANKHQFYIPANILLKTLAAILNFLSVIFKSIFFFLRIARVEDFNIAVNWGWNQQSFTQAVSFQCSHRVLKRQ